MSRVIGIVSNQLTENLKSNVVDMLDASCSSSHWNSYVENTGKATFGWCGWSTPNIVVVNGILAMIDGYIYNRNELGSVSDSDAVLLASLYTQYGFANALSRINGDFAVAIYDSRCETLWLGRDRFGVKPLYFIAEPHRFAFASRLKALLMLPGVSQVVNPQYVALIAAGHYRYFDHNPEKSPYTAISQLPAGRILRVTGDQVAQTKYWELQEQNELCASERELADRYRSLFLNAVSIRLNSAKKPAFTLSGGMDSSSVLASAVYLTKTKAHAFSTVYADQTYDESKEIQPMLSVAVKQWHPISVENPDVFHLVKRIIEANDEPVATVTWLSHFLLCEEAAKHGFRSLFGGLGGDELNAGEYEYFLYHFADLRLSGQEDQLKREVNLWIEYHNHPIFHKSLQVVEDRFSRLIDFNNPGRGLPDRIRLHRYASVLNPEFFDLKTFHPVMEHPFKSYLKNRTFQDITRETIPCCLRAEDRQTTTFGLDHFLPFFDHRLVEFMYRVPGRLKIQNGVTKYLLREAMRDVLPEETRVRVKKVGWNAPGHIWFAGSGRNQLLDLVHSRSFRERGIYNVTEILRIIDEHEKIVSSNSCQDNHMMFLWQLVNVELWLLAVDQKALSRV